MSPQAQVCGAPPHRPLENPSLGAAVAHQDSGPGLTCSVLALRPLRAWEQEAQRRVPPGAAGHPVPGTSSRGILMTVTGSKGFLLGCC